MKNHLLRIKKQLKYINNYPTNINDKDFIFTSYGDVCSQVVDWEDRSCTCHMGHPPCGKCENSMYVTCEFCKEEFTVYYLSDEAYTIVVPFCSAKCEREFKKRYHTVSYFPTKEQVEKASRYQLCTWHRFLPSADSEKNQDIQDLIYKRFHEVGGFTVELSKAIGWEK